MDELRLKDSSSPNFPSSFAGIRWLLSKGKHEEAKKILNKACKFNGTEMNVQTLSSLNEKIEMQKSKDANGNIADDSEWMKKISLKIVMQIANLAYCWFAVIFVYYGLNLNSVYLEYWNKYVNFVVSIKIMFISFGIFVMTDFS